VSNLDSELDSIQLEGATDGTKIGNVSDALKVSATFNQSPTDTPGCPVVSQKLRYEVDRTTVVLTASYQTIWSYTGSGKFSGIIVDCEANLTEFKFTVDTSNVVFEFQIKDLLDTSGNKEFSLSSLYTDTSGKKLIFTPGPELCPMVYTSNLKLEAKESTGKRVFGYVVGLTKET